jgi:glycosyltransferase involved in cell wall biosynthesis
MRFLARFVTRCAHGFVIHSESDRSALARSYGIADRPVAVIPHGPYDHYRLPDAGQPLRAAPPEACNLLFFGLIRPYKGLEDAVRAFEALCDESPSDFWLTVVGETWERWTLPGELIGASRHSDRITFVNRYVTDAEAARFFAGADVVVLPYRRGSASGTLHAAMALGLPVVATAVGGLREATTHYEGAVLTAPDDAKALEDALRRASTLRGMRFRDPHSWQRNVAKLLELFGAIERDR